MTSLTRYSTYKFNNEIRAQNRVVVPPMASKTADSKGNATSATLEHYQRLSQSKAGLIFVEYSYIHLSGRGETNQLGVDSDDKIEALSQLSQIIHKSGALAGLQIVHVGGKSKTELTGSALMSPSGIIVPIKGWMPDPSVAMTETDIQNWERWFLEAAGRAFAAKFDFVELHAAHGYGLNQWLSPITNQRQDLFGGSIQNRSRLLVNVIKKIKIQLPKLLVAVRLPAQDHLVGGLDFTDMFFVVKELEKLGVDLIDVSSGIGGWRRPEGQTGEGYLVDDATKIKAKISIPVIGVGGIETGEYIDEVIGKYKIDFAAVGRALLQDPKVWNLKNLNK